MAMEEEDSEKATDERNITDENVIVNNVFCDESFSCRTLETASTTPISSCKKKEVGYSNEVTHSPQYSPQIDQECDCSTDLSAEKQPNSYSASRKNRTRSKKVAASTYNPQQDAFADCPELNESDGCLQWEDVEVDNNSECSNHPDESFASLCDGSDVPQSIVTPSKSFVTPKRSRSTTKRRRSRNKLEASGPAKLNTEKMMGVEDLKILVQSHRLLKDIWRRTKRRSLKLDYGSPVGGSNATLLGIKPLPQTPLRRNDTEPFKQPTTPILNAYDKESEEFHLEATQPASMLILKGVIAYVEVRSSGDNRSLGVKDQLQKLGATISDSLSKDVTHVVFKEGLPSTIKKATQRNIPVVSVLWIEACKKAGLRVSERMYPAQDNLPKESSALLKKFRKIKSIQPDYEGKIENKKRTKKDSSLEDLKQAGKECNGINENVVTKVVKKRHSEGEKITFEAAGTSSKLLSPQSSKISGDSDTDGSPDALYLHKRNKKSNRRKTLIPNLPKWAKTSSEGNTVVETLVGVAQIRRKDFQDSTKLSCNQPLKKSVDESPLALRLLEKISSPLSIIKKTNVSNSHVANESNIAENCITVETPKKPRPSNLGRRFSANCTTRNKSKRKVTKKSRKSSHSVAKDSITKIFDNNISSTHSDISKENMKYDLTMSTENGLSLQSDRDISKVDTGLKNNKNKFDSTLQEPRRDCSYSHKMRISGFDENSVTCICDEDSSRKSKQSVSNIDNVKTEEVLCKIHMSECRNSEKHKIGVIMALGELDTSCKDSKDNYELSPNIRQCNKEEAVDSSKKSLDLFINGANCSAESANNSVVQCKMEVGNKRITVKNEKVLLPCVQHDSPEGLLGSCNNAGGFTASNSTSETVSLITKHSEFETRELIETASIETKTVSCVVNSKNAEMKFFGSVATGQTLAMGEISAPVEILKSISELGSYGCPLVEKSSRLQTLSEKQNEAVGSLCVASNIKLEEVVEEGEKGKGIKHVKSSGAVSQDLVHGAAVAVKSDDEFSSMDSDVATVDVQKCLDVITQDIETTATGNFLNNTSTVETFQVNSANDNAQTKPRKRKLITICDLPTMDPIVVNGFTGSDVLLTRRHKRRRMSASEAEKTQMKVVPTTKSSSEPDMRKTVNRRTKRSRISEDLTELWKQKKALPKTEISLLPSIVCTSLHTPDIELVSSVVMKLGGFTVEDKVVSSTTHVIAGSPRRTLNVVYAIARGLWVLRLDWVLHSLEAGHWIDEEKFEMVDFSPSVMKCRVERQCFGPVFRLDLFSSVRSIYVAKDCDPSKEDLEELVRLCGGHTVAVSRAASVIIGGRTRNKEVPCVAPKWVLDCITQGCMLPLENYVMEGVSLILSGTE